MTDRTNAERQRRYIARLKAQATKAGVTNADLTEAWAAERAETLKQLKQLEQVAAKFHEASAAISKLAAELGLECKRREAAEAAVVALKAELARAKPASPGHDALVQELAQAKERVARAEMGNIGLRRALAEAERKLAKPKVEKPPLPPDEARERVIKGLRTRVRHLAVELDAIKELNIKMALKTGDMPRATRTAIDWVLQPDQRRNADEAAWDRACKGWNAWKNDSDKVRRRV